ncbi:winged helix-turn-helix transcriptional regulator [Streptomyces sp. AV19]|uniref:MarR family winged helix-turn-helix transcriptional regulator n=1 Tax=Streptomyces sp. AV19 TaxID=2793068 RepID=UPI0018FE831F|nr:MarR family winged helix-turn-helix transcriptional regulator [Streptomyces sp. AV19]MBH1935811.1 winged helix-turn-helix transcriptional regulator [Streptomyces sp. AV19]MDG4536113.1 MarR family winged helix-turn-helix transcriptional regulator [Streptomyces sp. AV19]
MSRRSAPARQDAPGLDFPLVHRTGYLLHKAGTLLMQEADRALEQQGLRMRYFYVLAALEGGHDLSQQDLSRLLNLDPTTMVALVDELEGNGHVERRRNPADRRRYILRLTDEGRAVLGAAGEAVDAVEREFLAGAPEEDREQLRRILGHLLAGQWPRVIACE